MYWKGQHKFKNLNLKARFELKISIWSRELKKEPGWKKVDSNSWFELKNLNLKYFKWEASFQLKSRLKCSIWIKKLYSNCKPRFEHVSWIGTLKLDFNIKARFELKSSIWTENLIFLIKDRFQQNNLISLKALFQLIKALI